MGNEETQVSSAIEQKKAVRTAGLRAAPSSALTATAAAPSKSAPSGSEQSIRASAASTEDVIQEVPAKHKDAPAAESVKATFISNLFDDFDLTPEKNSASNAGQEDAAAATEPMQGKRPSENNWAPNNQHVKANSKEIAKPKVNLGFIVGILAAAVALVVGIRFYNWHSSPTQAAIRAVEQNDFVQATFYISQDLTGKENPKLQGMVVSKAAEVKDGYLAGTITFQDATSNMEALKKLGHTQTISYIEEMYSIISERETSRNAYQKAEQMYSSGRLPEAIKSYRLVAMDDPYYTDAQAALSEATLKYSASVIQTYNEYVNSRRLTEALTVLNDGLKTIPDDPEVLSRKVECEKLIIQQTQSDALDKAAELGAKHDYVGAMGVINKAIATTGQTQEMDNALQQYKDLYVEEVLAAIDECIETGDYSGAKKFASEAIKACPENERVISVKAVVDQYKTTGLDMLKAYNGGFEWNTGEAADPFGNAYTDVANYTILHGNWHSGAYEMYAEYNLNEEYSALSFTISPYDDYSENAESYVQVYVNDVLRYTSPQITRKTSQEKVNLDISDANTIRIVVQKDEYGCMILSDVKVTYDPYYQSNLEGGFVSLATLLPVNGGFAWENHYPKDPFGNAYSDVANYTILHGNWHSGAYEMYAEYNLNEEYSALSFTISPYDDYSENAASYVQVYVNDVLRYTSPQITRKTNQEKVNLDISDANTIRIVVQKDEYGCIMLSDVKLLITLSSFVNSENKAVSLLSLDAITGGFALNNGYPADPFGNAYTDVANYTILHGKNNWHGNAYELYAEYYINDNFSELSLNISPYKDFGDKAISTVEVFVDDKLVYSSPEIHRNTNIIHITGIDLSGATYLKIVVNKGEHGCVMLSDLMLTPGE